MGRRLRAEALSGSRTSRLLGNQADPATVTLTVDGETIAAVPGESIAAALTASGRLELRNDGNGNARGLLCGMGACFECRVSINGGPPQRACLTTVSSSMTVQTLGYPERLPDARCIPAPKARETIDCDVLVVGAGPAGVSAAVKLAEAGKRVVVVVDERHEAGGQYFKQKIAAVSTAGPDDRQYRDGRALLDRLRASNARVISGATVWGAFREESGQIEICATTDEYAHQVRPANLVVATGAYESVPPFPGWTLPGVMTTGAAQSLLRAYRVAPGSRVLIAGNGPLNLQLACELIRGGVDVVAVAESASAPMPQRAPAAARMLTASPGLCLQGLGYLRTLRKFAVPLHYGYHIQYAEGADKVLRGAIARLDSQGRLLEATAKVFSVDAICLGYRQRPSAELVKALGCRLTPLSAGVEIPERDRFGETSIPGVFAIGDGALPAGAQAAITEGRLVADLILDRPAQRREVRRLKRHRRFQRGLWSLYEAPDQSPLASDLIVCRCESVDAASLRSLVDAGVRDLGSLKRLSRAGMGLCQGRYCQQSLLDLVGEADRPEPLDSFATRNPVKPVTIAAIAAEKPEWRGYRPADLPSTGDSRPPKQSTLDEADVLIIGAGVIGAATALYLARAGADIMLIDRGQPNGEASGGNAGSLHLQLLPFDFHEDNVASPAATALPLQKLGIELWKELEQELQADFELSIGGGLMLADDESDCEFLLKKAALEINFGIDTDILSATETRELLPGVAGHIAGAAFCAGEGKINPLIATPHLLAAARRSGTRLGVRTTVTGIDRADRGYRVATNKGVIACNKVVNATGGWSAGIAALLGATLPVSSAPQQMLATQAVEPRFPYLLSLARRHLTMKQAANGNLLIGGGWPAGYDNDSARSVTLRDSIEGNLWVAQRVFPQLGGLQLIRSWGATGVMIDGAPIIGELPVHPGFYNVVGANGYTMGPILGRIVADLILTGRAPLDIAPFSVQRFDYHAVAEGAPPAQA